MIELLNSWRRSGFSVHTRVFVHPRDARELEVLVRYMMRPPVSRVARAPKKEGSFGNTIWRVTAKSERP